MIGYIRVSTDKQDLNKQKHLLLEYAQKNKSLIDEFIEVEISSTKNKKERKIDELRGRLKKGDTLLVAELSRLGRNMLETLNIIDTLTKEGIKIIFVRQPELSTVGHHTKLLFAIYSYFAEAEREYISIRTKQGLAVARLSGKKLGRPKGSKNKKGRVLDLYRDQIKNYLELQLTISSIAKVINNQLDKPISYNSYKYFLNHDQELSGILERRRVAD
ncbi:MAG: recombinase family protein [Desulfobacteraceae bacterium]|nr:recombinase family protein [Desulfobacteraceae bacterium]